MPLPGTVWKSRFSKKELWEEQADELLCGILILLANSNTFLKHTVYFSIDHHLGYTDNILPFNKHVMDTGYFPRGY